MMESSSKCEGFTSKGRVKKLSISFLLGDCEPKMIMEHFLVCKFGVDDYLGLSLQNFQFILECKRGCGTFSAAIKMK